jgi:hypothetical protein
MVSYLIIYTETTKHNEIKEKARRIRAGMCTERNSHSNWCSPADTPSLLPTVVAGLHVHYLRHRSSSKTFLFGKFVRDERRSWTEVPLYVDVYLASTSVTSVLTYPSSHSHMPKGWSRYQLCSKNLTHHCNSFTSEVRMLNHCRVQDWTKWQATWQLPRAPPYKGH